MKLTLKLPIKISSEPLGIPEGVEVAPEVAFELGGKGRARVPAASERLDVPLRESPRVRPGTDPNAISILPLLDWRARSGRFVFRREEFERLEAWASSREAVSVKLITAEGGAGKSALAAAFALKLQGEGWQAGFARLDESRAYDLGSRGLVVLDYPEEHLPILRQFLTTLGQQRTDRFGGRRLRVLLLSRQSQASWEQSFVDLHAAALLDPDPIDLRPLAADSEIAPEIFLWCTRGGERDLSGCATARGDRPEDLRNLVCPRRKAPPAAVHRRRRPSRALPRRGTLGGGRSPDNHCARTPRARPLSTPTASS